MMRSASRIRADVFGEANGEIAMMNTEFERLESTVYQIGCSRP